MLSSWTDFIRAKLVYPLQISLSSRYSSILSILFCPFQVILSSPGGFIFQMWFYPL